MSKNWKVKYEKNKSPKKKNRDIKYEPFYYSVYLFTSVQVRGPTSVTNCDVILGKSYFFSGSRFPLFFK